LQLIYIIHIALFFIMKYLIYIKKFCNLFKF